MNTRSIYFRLILWYSGIIIAVLLAFGYYTYVGVRSQLYSNLEHTLTRRAHQISANVLPHAAEKPADVATQIRAVYSPEANNRFIRISNADHDIVYVSGGPQDGRFNPANIPPAEANAPATRMEPLSYNDDMLITATHIEVNNTVYLIEMGAPTDEADQTLHGLLLTLLYGLTNCHLDCFGGWICAGQESASAGGSISPPPREEITFGNLSNRLPVATTGDALEHLSMTLNQMLDRLENAYEQASRFSADASHELRTPLTIIRGELESLAREHDMPLTCKSVLEAFWKKQSACRALLKICLPSPAWTPGRHGSSINLATWRRFRKTPPSRWRCWRRKNASSCISIRQCR